MIQDVLKKRKKILCVKIISSFFNLSKCQLLNKNTYLRCNKKESSCIITSKSTRRLLCESRVGFKYS